MRFLFKFSVQLDQCYFGQMIELMRQYYAPSLRKICVLRLQSSKMPGRSRVFKKIFLRPLDLQTFKRFHHVAEATAAKVWITE